MLWGPQVAAAIISAFVVVLVQVGTFLYNQGKMSNRHEENQRRFYRIEKALGIENGDPLFIRRTEAQLMLATAEQKHYEIDRRFDDVDKRLDIIDEKIDKLESRS